MQATCAVAPSFSTSQSRELYALSANGVFRSATVGRDERVQTTRVVAPSCSTCLITYLISAKKYQKNWGYFIKNKNIFNRVILIKLYKSMILLVIDYGSVVYDSLSRQQNNKIENLQRRAAIICSGAHPRTETNKLLGDLGWMHLKDRRLYLKRTYFYKIFVNASPPYLNADLMDLVRNPKVRETRRSNEGKLYQPKWKKAKYRASFSPQLL